MRKDWTYEECYEIALTCTHAWEMQKKNGSAYNAALRNGWRKDYTWFKRPKHCKWIYETCYAVAELCNSTVEMRAKYPTAYHKAADNDWIKDYTWFLEKRNIYTNNVYVIYSYYFEEYNALYVGLTHNIKERDKNHKKGKKHSAVYDFAIEHNCDIPNPSIIEAGLNPDTARIAEDLWVKYYKGLNYNILNKAKTGQTSGSLGACAKKWTKKTCEEAALKCTSRSEFAKKYSGAYHHACDNGYLNDYTWFIDTAELLSMANTKWDYDTCYAEARKYTTRNEFQKNSGGAYKAALDKGWLNDYYWFLSKSEAVRTSNFKSVLQYSLDGKLINSFSSIQEAGIANKLNNTNKIGQCCLGKRKTAYGYVWKYAA